MHTCIEIHTSLLARHDTQSLNRVGLHSFPLLYKLLDLFPEESGQKSKKHPRLIPYLPGKNYSNKFLKNRDVAEKRLPELHRYSRLVCMCGQNVIPLGVEQKN